MESSKALRALVGGAFLVAAATIAFGQKVVVAPYIQPGDTPYFFSESKEIWFQTDGKEKSVRVEFTPRGKMTQVAEISSVQLPTGRLYKAVLTPLEFDSSAQYRVSVNGQAIQTGTFRTRTLGPRIRFVAIGDTGDGSSAEKQVAYRISQTQPDFLVHTGDYVYANGLASEYRSHLFPIYNAETAGPSSGAPLMRQIPFYMILGNHDVFGLNLNKYPDGLAAFYYNSLPLNGPRYKSEIKAIGNDSGLKSAGGKRWPAMANYTFRYGNAFFLCLDSNSYMNPLDPTLVKWMEERLGETKATWKVVLLHAAPFSSSPKHYDYQPMRKLAPIFEKYGVSLVLAGHVHGYQRTKPLSFIPQKTNGGKVIGKFAFDETFDGKTRTQAKYPIYVVTGAGSASLYDRELTDKPTLWNRKDPSWAPYTVKLISNQNSFTTVDIDGKQLTLRQINVKGKELDRIRITKN